MPVNIKELIDNGYIVICDTNVYLHIYRFSPEFSDFALRCMQAIQSGIIMPSTVRYEFLKHYRGYFSKMEKRVQNVGDDTKKQISNAARKVLNLCDNLQSLQYPDIEELRADLSQKFDELMAIPEAFFEDRTILDLIANPWKGQDPVYNLVELIINDSRVMTSVTQEEIYQICEEGERRYKTDPQTPPGFKDAKNKDGVRKYSDLIMWKEILRYAREKSVNVIFVTDDVKSDWWIDDNGQREFHPYLCQEFQRETQMQIVALTALDFFSNISVTYGIPKSDAVEIALRITDDDYFERVHEAVFDRRHVNRNDDRLVEDKRNAQNRIQDDRNAEGHRFGDIKQGRNERHLADRFVALGFAREHQDQRDEVEDVAHVDAARGKIRQLGNRCPCGIGG